MAKKAKKAKRKTKRSAGITKFIAEVVIRTDVPVLKKDLKEFIEFQLTGSLIDTDQSGRLVAVSRVRVRSVDAD